MRQMYLKAEGRRSHHHHQHHHHQKRINTAVPQLGLHQRPIEAVQSEASSYQQRSMPSPTPSVPAPAAPTHCRCLRT